MSTGSVHCTRRSPAAWGLLALAALAGLIAVHHLGPARHVTAGGHHAQQSASASATTDDCNHVDHDCPADDRDHLGQVCQASSPDTGPVIATTPQTNSAAPVTPYRAVASPLTAAVDARGGSGCGPPSLVGLSVSRI